MPDLTVESRLEAARKVLEKTRINYGLPSDSPDEEVFRKVYSRKGGTLWAPEFADRDCDSFHATGILPSSMR